MQPRPLHGINGRLRQHITKVGAAYANRISSPQRAINEDDYLRALLHGGSITEEHLQKAVDAYNGIPSNFVWLQDVDDSVLDRADDVFLAKYGRDPTEDADFRVNGDYYKICKNLKRDRHHYDTDLKKLRWDYDGKDVSPRHVGKSSRPSVADVVKADRIAKTTKYSVGAVMLLCIVTFFGSFQTHSEVVVAIAGIGVFVAVLGLVLAFPPYHCPRCHKGCFKPFPRVCKRCGVRLEL